MAAQSKWKILAMCFLPCLHAAICLLAYFAFLIHGDEWRVIVYWIAIAYLDKPFSFLVMHRNYSMIKLAVGGTLWWLLINVSLYWIITRLVAVIRRRRFGVTPDRTRVPH